MKVVRCPHCLTFVSPNKNNDYICDNCYSKFTVEEDNKKIKTKSKKIKKCLGS